MKRCLAILLSVLLMLTMVPMVSADIIYNDDQLDWGGFFDPNAPCTHRTRTRHEAVASTCAVAGHGAYAVCNDCGILLEGSDEALPLLDHTYDNTYDPDCNGCGAVREVGEVPADYNLIKNGGFESVDMAYWDIGQLGYAVLNQYSYEGKYALKFECVIAQDGIRVQPHTDYVLTFWATWSDGMTAKMMTGDQSDTLIQIDTQSVDEWTQFGGVFNSGDQTELYFLLNGFGFIDDIVLIQAAACEHVYDNTCDATCNWCNAVRTALDHPYDVFVEQDVTCGADGVVHYVCTVCNHRYTEVIPATGEHQFDGHPCCEQQCVGCGAVIPAPADHEYVVIGSGEAGCGQDGWIDYGCVYCGDSYSETIPATGEHAYDNVCDEYCNDCGDWREVNNHDYVPGREIAPGCATEGLREYVCTNCQQFYMETLPPTGKHSYDSDCDADCNDCGQWREVGEHVYELTRDVAPTCISAGLREYTCVHCGESYMETIAAIDHVYDDVYDAECNHCGFIRDALCKHDYNAVVTAPTCTASGYTTYTCAKCGDSYVADETAAKGHTEVVVVGKEATCTESGLTEGKKCSVCGEITVAQQTIPAKGHTEVVVAGKEATCTESGLTEGKQCSVCGEILVAQQTIPAKGHTEVIVSGKEATCTESGLTEGKKCSVCGEIIVAQQTIPAKGHTEVIVAGKEATCTESGLTEGKKCSVCGEIIVAQQVIPAKGHTEVIVSGKEATCTESGLTEGKKCSVCGEIIVAQQTIPAKGHTVVILVGKEATCTESGLTAGAKCDICGEILVAQDTIPAKGHVYDDDNDPDCNTCGYLRDVVLKGDADGNGRVNNRDLGVLQQYLNEWPVSIDEAVIDMDGNGRINNRDLGLFQRYLNDL